MIADVSFYEEFLVQSSSLVGGEGFTARRACDLA